MLFECCANFLTCDRMLYVLYIIVQSNGRTFLNDILCFNDKL